jgi:hypothetical protein
MAGAVTTVLDSWADRCGFATLHDVAAPGRRTAMDHVVVGAGGVAVIDQEAPSAKLSRRRELDRLRADVAAVDAILRERGIVLPVRGFLCIDAPAAGLSPDAVVRSDDLYTGTPEAIARMLSQGNVCTEDEAAAAVETLSEALAPRAVRPVGSLVTGPPVRSVAPPLPPRVRRRRRTSRRRLYARLAVALVLAVAVGAWLRDSSSDARLSPGDVSNMLPALRMRAEIAAGGPVRGPAMTVTTDQILLRFRRGACRVVLTVDRGTKRSAAEVPLSAGTGCTAP